MFKLKKILLPGLFAASAVLAWDNYGLVQVGGLFLLDQNGEKVSVKYSRISDSVEVADWRFSAGFGHYHYNLSYENVSENPQYSWNFDGTNSINIGHAGVSRDFLFVGFDVDVYSLPLLVASTRWHMPDSLVYAGASLGRGSVAISGIDWTSEQEEDYIPEVFAVYKDGFLTKRFSLGAFLAGHRLEGTLSFLDTHPVDDELGYAFTDSSNFWMSDVGYSYEGAKNRFGISHAYLYGDLRLYGIVREQEKSLSEKRFAHFPLGMDINLFDADYVHVFDGGSTLSFRASYLQVELVIPWEPRRFYETLAPNRALKNSTLKSLSFGVFQRAFRVYGDLDGNLVDAGTNFSLKARLGNLVLNPELALDYFYAKFDSEIRIRMESSGVFYVKHTTDTWLVNGLAYGIVLGGAFRISDYRERFFVSVDAFQIAPFHYGIESLKVEPPPEIIDPGIIDPGVLPPPPPEEDGPSFFERMRDKASLAISNGFFIGISAGMRF